MIAEPLIELGVEKIHNVGNYLIKGGASREEIHKILAVLADYYGLPPSKKKEIKECTDGAIDIANLLGSIK